MATNVKEKKLRDLRIQVAGPTEELNKLAWKVASHLHPQKRTASAVLDAKPEPKKARSAFFIWLFEVGRKEIIAKQFGGSGKDVTAIAKAAGVKWGSMSDVDKKQWNEKAEKDKARYNKEMESYELSAKSEPKKNSQSVPLASDKVLVSRIGQAPAAPQVQRCDTTPEQKRATRKLPAESEAKKVATGRRTTAAKKSISKEPASLRKKEKENGKEPASLRKRKKENGKGKTKENGKEEEKEGKKRSREGSDEDSRSDSSIASSSDSSSDSTESIPPAKRRKRIYRR